jgi:hypothetical protein
VPNYDKSPFKKPPQLLIPGQSSYVFGSLNTNASPTQIQVSSVAIAANVATVVGNIFGGDVPLVGGLISIRGTQTGSGAFNVTNAAILSVTFVPATSQVTVTYALTHANVSVTADAGLALVPVAEVPETTTTNVASVAVAVQQNETFLQGGRQLSVTILGTGVYQLQGANFDQDSEYTSLGACTDNAVTQFGPFNHRFYRLLPTTGGSAVGRIDG